MRVFALSDIHTDYPDNMRWIQNLPAAEYRRDALLLAGDVTHHLGRLETTLGVLRERFAQVFYVIGNHEAWLIGGGFGDSLAKFERILERCAALGVHTSPAKVGEDGDPVWVVPLFSWYVKPEEGPDSLYLPKEGEDPDLEAWGDDYFVRWPRFDRDRGAADFFAEMNRPRLERSYDAPVISLSHFVPRSDLMFALDGTRPPADVSPSRRRFNFSRVAGAKSIDAQIRQLGSTIHVYGHQHRNRHRRVDGVVYVSHCLGYVHERQRNESRHLNGAPKLIWDSLDPLAGRPSREY